MKIDEGSRRYAVFNASDKYKGNTEFFSNFVKKFHNQEFANILYTCLLKKDLNNFNILNFPKSNALKELIDRFKGIEEQILDLAHNHIQACFAQEYREHKYEYAIKAKDLYKSYLSAYSNSYENSRKRLGKYNFIQKMVDLGFFIKIKRKECTYLDLTEKYRNDFDLENKCGYDKDSDTENEQ